MAFVSRLTCAVVACVCAAAALSRSIDAQVTDATALLDRTIAAAEDNLRIGERETAESHYRTALLQAWMILGAAHVTSGRLQDARQAFERAASSAIENNAALRSLALVQLQAGEGEAAVAILTRLVSAAPRDVQLRLTLAQALVATGEPAQAAQELDEAQAIAPADPELLFALASGYLRVKKVEAADAVFARVVKTRPLPETHVLIGRTYRDFHYYDRARSALRVALKMDPRVRRAHYYLGTSAILEEGVVRLDEAITEFRKELQIAPDDPLATLRLGVVLVEARRYEEAMPLLEKAVRGLAPPYRCLALPGTLSARDGTCPRRGRLPEARARHRYTGRRCAGLGRCQAPVRSLSAGDGVPCHRGDCRGRTRIRGSAAVVRRTG